MMGNAKKYIVVLLAVFFSAAALTLNAFAETDTSSNSSSSSSSSSGTSSDSSSSKGGNSSGTPGGGTENPGGDGNGGVDEPDENEDIAVTLDYNDGSAPKTISVAPGTPVKTLTVPKRSGYSFDCWTMNGTEVLPSFEIYSPITLTARWIVSEDSSRKPSSYASVDTHESEIEQAASRAEEAISDPDVLSSQDWGSLLSAGSQAEAGTAAQSSQAPSGTAQGGGAWLFPVGIALIVLSACGIGIFVYLQFFSAPGPGKPGSTGGGDSRPKDMEFTDISSHSDGPYAAPEDPGEAPAESHESHTDEAGFTRPLPADLRTLHAARLPSGLPKAQAKPVDGGKSDFDWDKFFNDDF